MSLIQGRPVPSAKTFVNTPKYVPYYRSMSSPANLYTFGRHTHRHAGKFRLEAVVLVHGPT